MAGVSAPAILAAIHARLDRALRPPALHLRPFVAASARLERFGPRLFQVRADRVELAGVLDDERSRSAAMADVAATLRAEGALPGWRDELYRVAPAFDAPAALHIERGAA